MKEIKERKSRNRKIRNNVEENNKEQLEKEYKEQKDKVSKMVREAITLYEKRNSEEIANNRNKVWENNSIQFKISLFKKRHIHVIK